MDKDLRASLVAAGSAAALSALVGIFAGVGFFTILLRALVGALLIGGMVYAGILLLRSMVPEVFSATEGDEGAEVSPDEDSERGANIDIVLPGEAARAESFVPSDELSAYASLAGSGGHAGVDPGEAESDELVAELNPVEDATLLDSDVGEAEAVAALPTDTDYGKGRRSSLGFDDLDVLPDLEGFSDVFTASEFSSGGSSSTEQQPKSRGGPSSTGSRQGQDGVDPASLAQAVRTILKRDQKG